VLLATLVGCFAYLGAASSPTTGLWSHEFHTDVPVYESYAQRSRHEVPIRDFTIEYPPASLLAFLPPMWAKDALGHVGVTGVSYAALFKTEMLIFGLLVVFIVASTAQALWGDRRRTVASALVVGISPLVLGPISLSWYDMWPTLLTIAAMALFVRNRLATSFGLLGLAIAAKLFALVLVPLLVVQALRDRGKQALLPVGVLFATTAIAFGAAAILSLKGARYPFTYLVDRPVEIESTAGSIVGLEQVAGWRTLERRESYGSINFEGNDAAYLGAALGLIGLLLLLLLWWRSATVTLSAQTLIARSTAAIAIALAASKVFSPQYLVWLVPLVALTSRRTALVVLATAVVLTRVWFPERWAEFNDIPPLFALAAPRNLAICLLAAVLIFDRVHQKPRARTVRSPGATDLARPAR
jgi:hypothetical protein